jgi:DNA polymerase I-like protein with 3'-5' exonuclease and polymerase domains
MRILSIDTETTGVDIKHGSRPYIVTVCDQDMNQSIWEWMVDPMTRMPVIPPGDLYEIEELILTEPEDGGYDLIIGQNIKFDVKALASVKRSLGDYWPWRRTKDTLIAAHMIDSAARHDLTSLALEHLMLDLQPYEDRMKEAVRAATRRVKDRGWMLLKPGAPWCPSSWGGDPPKIKEGSWKADAWLPRAVAFADRLPKSDSWWTVTGEYANSDSASTMLLFKEQEQLLKEKGLERIYDDRMLQVPVIYDMEDYGVTVVKSRLTEAMERFKSTADECYEKCVSLSRGKLEKLPSGGRSKNLESLLFDEFKLDTERKTKKGGKALDQFVIEDWLNELPEESDEHKFLKSLKTYRKMNTGIRYHASYIRFGIEETAVDGSGVIRLYPSVNLTGTRTLRGSSSNPSEQQISNKEEANIREAFGPAPGREWWSLDYENIELRIPAYECEEEELINLFEKPNEPPFYGSEHLLNFSIVYPDIWEETVKKVGYENAGPYIKKEYKSTWYKWCKNGDFAVGYGAIDRPGGTADKAFRRVGSHARLKEKFSKKESLNQHFIRMAYRTGFVETMPDKEVDPERGYPLRCPRDFRGTISPTIPLNYHVQGTACWVVRRATVKVNEYLSTLPQWHLIMDIHDELVIDAPFKPDRGNQPKVDRVRRIMESMGDCIGVPLRVGVSYHPVNWRDEE